MKNFLRRLFRKNSIIYYGPYRCEACERFICREALEQGGGKFDYPDGPIYPNTKWAAHVCLAQ